MEDEKINVRITESGQNIEVLVLSKNPDRIQVLLGEGANSVRCQLLPTPNGRAYAGSVMGREIVYECSSSQVKAEILRENQARQKNYRR